MELSRWVAAVITSYATDQDERCHELFFSTKLQGHSLNSMEVKKQIMGILQEKLEEPEEITRWGEFLLRHALATMKSAPKQSIRAYQGLLAIFDKEEITDWFMGIIIHYSKTVFWKVSERSQLNTLFSLYRGFMGTCQRAFEGKEYRAKGLFIAVILLLRVMFRLTKLQNWSAVARILENEHSKLPPLETYPKSQQVEVHYYQGRYAIYLCNYDEALEHLQFAFATCLGTSIANKRVILRYLVPLYMLRNILPSRRLLEKYQLLEYWDLVQSVRQGNLSEFERIYDSRLGEFINLGLFILFAEVKLIVCCTAFRKVHHIVGETKVPLSKFQVAMPSKSVAEIECILGVLIERGYIRGYIASENKVAVLSNKEPFPTKN